MQLIKQHPLRKSGRAWRIGNPRLFLFFLCFCVSALSLAQQAPTNLGPIRVTSQDIVGQSVAPALPNIGSCRLYFDITTGAVTGINGTGGICSTGSGASGVQYNAAGAYLVNQGTRGSGDAIQTFPCDQWKCTLVIGTYTTAPSGGVLDGSIGLTSGILTSGVAHLSVATNGIFYVAIGRDDSVCDFVAGCSGSGPVLNQTQPILFGPTLLNPIVNNLTILSADGNFAQLQPGTGKYIAGSVSSGVFQGPVNNAVGETLKQNSTHATTTYILTEPSGGILTTTITGSPDNSHNWVGQSSGAVFAPSATPTTPYCQYAPAAGYDYICFGSDGKFNISNDGAPLYPALTQGPSLASNFTTANNTNFQTITDGTNSLALVKNAKAAKSEFHCHLIYSQASGTAAITFAILATNAPVNMMGSGEMFILAGSSPVFNAFTGSVSTSDVTLVTGTPNATGTAYRVTLDGTIEDSAQANTFAIQVKTATGGDPITIYRGSSCEF